MTREGVLGGLVASGYKVIAALLVSKNANGEERYQGNGRGRNGRGRKGGRLWMAWLGRCGD
jgi:hypothetical protein